MLTLFNNRLAPLTYALGFLNAEAKEATKAIKDYLAGGPNTPTTVTQLTGTLEENLLHLQPLTIGCQPPLLLTSTKLDGWTAVFDGDAYGQGVESLVRRMGYIKNIPGYFTISIPPAVGPSYPLGGRKFLVFGPGARLGYIRTISLIENFPKKWIFDLSGEPQPYEDLNAYKKHRKTDRLTDDMLLKYTAAVGLHPWDENFYTNPTYLITNNQTPALQYTLTQARQKLKLQD